VGSIPVETASVVVVLLMLRPCEVASACHQVASQWPAFLLSLLCVRMLHFGGVGWVVPHMRLQHLKVWLIVLSRAYYVDRYRVMRSDHLMLLTWRFVTSLDICGTRKTPPDQSARIVLMQSFPAAAGSMTPYLV